jgi:hypothetical protein
MIKLLELVAGPLGLNCTQQHFGYYKPMSLRRLLNQIHLLRTYVQVTDLSVWH